MEIDNPTGRTKIAKWDLFQAFQEYNLRKERQKRLPLYWCKQYMETHIEKHGLSLISYITDSLVYLIQRDIKIFV